MKLKILLIAQLLLLFLQGLSLLKDGFTEWKTRKNFPSSSLTLSAAAVATIHNSIGETEATEKKGKLVRKLLPIFPSRQTNNSLALSLQSCVLPSAANKNFILSTFHFTLTQFFTTMMKVYDEEWKSSYEMTTFLVSYELMCAFSLLDEKERESCVNFHISTKRPLQLGKCKQKKSLENVNFHSYLFAFLNILSAWSACQFLLRHKALTKMNEAKRKKQNVFFFSFQRD